MSVADMKWNHTNYYYRCNQHCGNWRNYVLFLYVSHNVFSGKGDFFFLFRTNRKFLLHENSKRMNHDHWASCFVGNMFITLVFFLFIFVVGVVVCAFMQFFCESIFRVLVFYFSSLSVIRTILWFHKNGKLSSAMVLPADVDVAVVVSVKLSIRKIHMDILVYFICNVSDFCLTEFSCCWVLFSFFFFWLVVENLHETLRRL